MTPYENYLLNDFKPYTIENNPFQAGSDSTRVAPNWDTSSVVQGELANKPLYNARGERYGSTLSDDMFDIKNHRVGNYTDSSKPTSKHPWIDDYVDYVMPQPLPTLKPTDYSTAPTESAVNPIDQYFENNPYLSGNKGDFRDRAISRKRNYGDPNSVNDFYAWGNANEGYELDLFEDPDFAQYMANTAYRDALLDQIEDLRTGGPNTDWMDDSIYDDMKYIKSGGKTGHAAGNQTPRYNAVNDPALPTEDEWGLLVNPERLSPATAELIAKGTTRDRSEPYDIFGEREGLNPLINEYRRKLGLTNHVPSGGAYMQGIY